MPDFTPLQAFCLTAISREAPLSTETILNDLETLWANGQAIDLREESVEQVLGELAGMGLIQETGIGWTLADKKPGKRPQLQGALFE